MRTEISFFTKQPEGTLKTINVSLFIYIFKNNEQIFIRK